MRPSPVGGTPLPRPQTPPLDRALSSLGIEDDLDELDDVDDFEVTVEPMRIRSAPTVGETPLTRGDNTTSERGSSNAIDETAPVPDNLIMDVKSAPVALPLDFGGDSDADVDPDELVPVRPELASLQVVIYEESAHVATVQGAVVAAGHVVNVGATGRDGFARAISAIRGGGIDVVIAGLPGGEPVIDAALDLEPRRPIVIAALTCAPVDAVDRAHAAGADLVVTRPHDVERLAPALLAASRLVVEKRIAVAARGAEQVLRSRIDEFVDTEPGALLPFEMFQRVLELEIKRARRYEYPLSVALFAVEVDPPPPPAGIRGILRARAGNALINTIRDIDMATQLDHERFLVLLPYTDLKGSAGVGRRVIAAVAALDPVVALGRSFQPRVVGAVAGGGPPDQQVSFAKLIKDATRALEQARRDGAELAVQP